MKKRLIILVVLILGISAVGCNKMEAQPEETTLKVKDGVIDYNPGKDTGLNEEVDAEVTNLINTKLEGEKCDFGVIIGEVGSGELEESQANCIGYDGVVTYIMIYRNDYNNYTLEFFSTLRNLTEDIADIYKKYDLKYEVYVDAYAKDGEDDYYSKVEHHHSLAI